MVLPSPYLFWTYIYMDIGALIHFIYCHHRTMCSDFYQILTGIGGTHFSKYRSIFHQFMDYVLCTRNENWVKAMCFIHICMPCVSRSHSIITLHLVGLSRSSSGMHSCRRAYRFFRPCLALQQEFGGRRGAALCFF